jgi:SAM-dependent methyltransferase
MSFNDYFSRHAAAYAAHRPHYPAALFDYLARLAPARRRAWDCGTGSGQAAAGLAAHFELVIATDASADQVCHAHPHARVVYGLARAEQAPLPAGAIDLITVAQALHWFDIDRFYGEVRRVLAAGGIVAAWCYGLLRVSPALDRLLDTFYRDIEPHWPPERRFIAARYATLPFPFTELLAPEFVMSAEWRAHDALGYLRTWSAVQRCMRASGTDPVAGIEAELRSAWGPTARRVEWPLYFRIGSV